MSAEIFQYLRATFDSFVNVEAANRSRRTHHFSVALGKHNRGAVKGFGHTRGSNTEHAFMPVVFVKHDRFKVFKSGRFSEYLFALFGYLLIKFFALFIVSIEGAGEVVSYIFIFRQQQFYGGAGTFYAPHGINHRSDAEYYIAHGQGSTAVTFIDECFQSDAVSHVQPFHSVVSQDTIFAAHFYNITSNTDGDQVQ